MSIKLNFTDESGIPHEEAYIRVEILNIAKENDVFICRFRTIFYHSESLTNMKPFKTNLIFKFEYNLDGKNAVEQAYDFLKTQDGKVEKTYIDANGEEQTEIIQKGIDFTEGIDA